MSLERHKGEKPFKCPFGCGKAYLLKGDLNRHLHSHTKESKFKCDCCGKTFSRSTVLRIHMRTHTGEKPFVCPLEGCGTRFPRRDHLMKHMKIVHFVCPVEGCGKAFARRGLCTKHVKVVHGTVSGLPKLIVAQLPQTTDQSCPPVQEATMKGSLSPPPPPPAAKKDDRGKASPPPPPPVTKTGEVSSTLAPIRIPPHGLGVTMAPISTQQDEELPTAKLLSPRDLPGGEWEKFGDEISEFLKNGRKSIEKQC